MALPFWLKLDSLQEKKIWKYLLLSPRLCIWLPCLLHVSSLTLWSQRRPRDQCLWMLLPPWMLMPSSMWKQGWRMKMCPLWAWILVVDIENLATEFLHSQHVVASLLLLRTWPSLETMARLNLGTACQVLWHQPCQQCLLAGLSRPTRPWRLRSSTMRWWSNLILVDATAAGSDTPRCKVLVGPHICCGTQLWKRSASVGRRYSPSRRPKHPPTWMVAVASGSCSGPAMASLGSVMVILSRRLHLHVAMFSRRLQWMLTWRSSRNTLLAPGRAQDWGFESCGRCWDFSNQGGDNSGLEARTGGVELVFHADAAYALKLGAKLTSADVPPIWGGDDKGGAGQCGHPGQCGGHHSWHLIQSSFGGWPPKGQRGCASWTWLKFKEVLKRKFLEGPGSSQSSWEPEYGGSTSPINLNRNCRSTSGMVPFAPWQLWGSPMWIWIPTRPGIMRQMLCLCDGEIRLHAARWTKYESSEASAEAGTECGNGVGEADPSGPFWAPSCAPRPFTKIGKFSRHARAASRRTDGHTHQAWQEGSRSELLHPTNPDTATGSPTIPSKEVSLQKLPKRAKSKAVVALNLIISGFLRRSGVTILDNHFFVGPRLKGGWGPPAIPYLAGACKILWARMCLACWKELSEFLFFCRPPLFGEAICRNQYRF